MSVMRVIFFIRTNEYLQLTVSTLPKHIIKYIHISEKQGRKYLFRNKKALKTFYVINNVTV